MTAWRRAEAQPWEKVEDRRWLGFWRLETRARKEWAELHKRQEDMRQKLDRENRTLLGRLRIWQTERSLRELVGALRGRVRATRLDVSTGPREPSPQAVVILSEGAVVLKRSHA